LTHRMETRVENAARLVAVAGSAYHELDVSCDRLTVLVDELQRFESDTGTQSQNVSVALTSSQNLPPSTFTGELKPVTATTGVQPTLGISSNTQPTVPTAAARAPIDVTDPRVGPPRAPAGAAQRAILRVRA